MDNDGTEMITYEEFERYINDIKEYVDLISELTSVCIKHNKDFDCLFADHLMCDTIDLLEKLTNDINQNISHWIFEMDFGRKHEQVQDGIKDLWNIITQDRKDK